MGIEEICAEAVAREVKTAMPEILCAIENAIREVFPNNKVFCYFFV